MVDNGYDCLQFAIIQFMEIKMMNAILKNTLATALLATMSTAAVAQEGFVPVAGAALGANNEGFPITDNTLLQTLTLNAGPLALGLGAIIAIGAISGGGKTTVSTPNVK